MGSCDGGAVALAGNDERLGHRIERSDNRARRSKCKMVGVKMPDSVNIHTRIAHEIESLHEFIARWFRGDCERSDAAFDAGIARRLAPQLVNIQPSGQTLTLQQLVEPIRAAYGLNPDFRIRISDVVLRYIDDSSKLVLATYLEHQSGARNTIPSSNTRTSSVLFQLEPDGDRLVWLHIHETAVPRV